MKTKIDKKQIEKQKAELEKKLQAIKQQEIRDQNDKFKALLDLCKPEMDEYKSLGTFRSKGKKKKKQMTNQQIAESLLVAYRKVLEQSVYYDEDFIVSILRELVNQLKYIGITEKNILEIADELEAH